MCEKWVENRKVDFIASSPSFFRAESISQILHCFYCMRLSSLPDKLDSFYLLTGFGATLDGAQGLLPTQCLWHHAELVDGNQVFYM